MKTIGLLVTLGLIAAAATYHAVQLGHDRRQSLDPIFEQAEFLRGRAELLGRPAPSPLAQIANGRETMMLIDSNCACIRPKLLEAIGSLGGGAELVIVTQPSLGKSDFELGGRQVRVMLDPDRTVARALNVGDFPALARVDREGRLTWLSANATPTLRDDLREMFLAELAVGF